MHAKPHEFKDRCIVFQGLKLNPHITELRVSLNYDGYSSYLKGIVLDNEIIPAIREAINNRMPTDAIGRLKLIATLAQEILDDTDDSPLCVSHIAAIKDMADEARQANEFEQAELDKK
jgi:hypothetical protein